jgi:hypothetical protein
MTVFTRKRKVGRPSKYNHGQVLIGAERVKARRAKKILATVNLTSLRYRRVIWKTDLEFHSLSGGNIVKKILDF